MHRLLTVQLVDTILQYAELLVLHTKVQVADTMLGHTHHKDHILLAALKLVWISA